MNDKSSRRNFLVTAGLALPTAALASTTSTRQKDAKPPLTSPAGLSYRVLGKTGLKVTRVGFGCMITSDPSVIEKGRRSGHHLFRHRARLPGRQQRAHGRRRAEGQAQQPVLSTKTEPGTKEEALEHLETSLRELGTDHVDIWYLHGKSKPEDLTDELMEAQQIAKKAGKIRFAGVSTHGGQAEVVPAMVEKMPHFDVILIAYNFSMDPAMDGLIESAAKQGLGIVAMKVMAGGFRRLNRVTSSTTP